MVYIPNVNDVTLKMDVNTLSAEQLEVQVTYHVNNPDAIGQSATITVQSVENGIVVDLKQVTVPKLVSDNVVGFFVPNYPSHNRTVVSTAFMMLTGSLSVMAQKVAITLGTGTSSGGGPNPTNVNKIVLIDTFCGTIRTIMTPSELTDWRNIQGTMTSDPRFDANVPNSLNYRVLDGTVFDASTVTSSYSQIKACYDAHPNDGSNPSKLSTKDIGIILATVVGVGGIGWLAFRKKR